MGRLPQGMRRTPNGKIELRFSYQGKRFSVVGVDVPDVLQREREKLEELKTQVYVKNRDVRIKDYYAEYLARWQNSVKAGTAYNFKKAMDLRIIPVIGKIKVREIEIRTLQNLYNQFLEDGLSIGSANNYMNYVSKMMHEAVLDGIIKNNPCKRVRQQRRESNVLETKHRALSRTEQARFEEAIEGSWYEYLLRFMLYSGCRLGEALALCWDCVDFKNKTICIRRTITKSETGTETIGESTKTDSGARVLPMTDTLKRCLLEQRKRDFAMFGMLGDLVFISKISGKMISQTILNKAIRRILRKMPDVEVFTSHALRDTFATRFLESGGNMKTLQKLLGHASFAMTSDIYAHVLPDTKHNEMENMEKYIKGGDTIG